MAVYQCNVNPLNPTKCCANGRNIFRFFSVEKDRFVPIPMSSAFAEREPMDYTAHAWLPEDRCVLGTRSGELLIFEKEDLMVSLPAASLVPSAVTCITPCARGFIAGSDQGVVRLYERADPSGAVYSVTKDFRIPSSGTSSDIPARIVCMALSPTEELLSVSLSSCQLMQLNLSLAETKEDTTFTPVRPASSPSPSSCASPRFPVFCVSATPARDPRPRPSAGRPHHANVFFQRVRHYGHGHLRAQAAHRDLRH